MHDRQSQKGCDMAELLTISFLAKPGRDVKIRRSTICTFRQSVTQLMMAINQIVTIIDHDPGKGLTSKSLGVNQSSCLAVIANQNEFFFPTISGTKKILGKFQPNRARAYSGRSIKKNLIYFSPTGQGRDNSRRRFFPIKIFLQKIRQFSDKFFYGLKKASIKPSFFSERQPLRQDYKKGNGR